MQITTRNGYRKSLVAKKYIDQVYKKYGVLLTLAESRKNCEVIKNIIKALAKLNDKQKIKVIKACMCLFE